MPFVCICMNRYIIVVWSLKIENKNSFWRIKMYIEKVYTLKYHWIKDNWLVIRFFSPVLDNDCHRRGSDSTNIMKDFKSMACQTSSKNFNKLIKEADVKWRIFHNISILKTGINFRLVSSHFCKKALVEIVSN